MARTSPTFSNEMTPEQRAYSERQARKREADQRKRNDMLGFWRHCQTPRCRRDHGCSADPHACFSRHWAMIDEADKEWVRGAILAKLGGARSIDEIKRAADARREEYFNNIDKFAQLRRAAGRKPLKPKDGPAAEPEPQAGCAPEVRIRQL
jgi:hypothetical protein